MRTSFITNQRVENVPSASETDPMKRRSFITITTYAQILRKKLNKLTKLVNPVCQIKFVPTKNVDVVLWLFFRQSNDAEKDWKNDNTPL
mmetsp:Transcript_11836/g.18172  ORF Transcript_11836/g.18172 Transcript_11836/m.18172 type:complete len:89 (+) Transcript_11836:165-431(+)